MDSLVQRIEILNFEVWKLSTKYSNSSLKNRYFGALIFQKLEYFKDVTKVKIPTEIKPPLRPRKNWKYGKCQSHRTSNHSLRQFFLIRSQFLIIWPASVLGQLWWQLQGEILGANSVATTLGQQLWGNYFGATTLVKCFGATTLGQLLWGNCLWVTASGQLLHGKLLWSDYFEATTLGKLLWGNYFGATILGQLYWGNYLWQLLCGNYFEAPTLGNYFGATSRKFQSCFLQFNNFLGCKLENVS